MSDISIPGFSNQNSTINTEQVIEDLLELERVPIARVEARIGQHQLEREVWFDIGRRVTQLSDDASFLFGFQNPFNERVGVSADETALTLTPTRGAEERRHTIAIIQNAGRDRLLSRDIADDYQVPPGRYTFAIGGERVTAQFDGGSLRAFSDAINSVAPELLSTQVVRASDATDTIIFESQLYGSKNRLSFSDDALSFAEENGIIAYKEVQKFQDESERIIPAESEEQIPLAEQITPDSATTLTFTAAVESVSIAGQPAGFQLAPSGSITLQDVTVPNINSEVPLEDVEIPPVIVDNEHPTFVYAQLANGAEVPLADIPLRDEPQAQEISLAEISAPITALILRNENTHRILTVSEIGINSAVNSDYEALNAAEQAQDAILTLDGVQVTRNSNSIDDLIPQVTVEVLAAQSEALEVEVTPDYENIKNSVIRFVGSYNQLVRELNILARRETEIIDELEFLDDDERAQAQERLGLLQGETALSQLRNQLVNFVQNPYPTSAGRTVNLLSQVGIATNVGGFNSGGVNRSRLRGYLELDESQFDIALKDQFQAVRELFGSDTDQDLVVDSGLAYEIDRYADLYTRNGGIIQIRTDGLDGRIERNNDELVNYNQKIEDYERKLRSDFGRMQGALNSLDSTTQALERLQN